MKLCVTLEMLQNTLLNMQTALDSYEAMMEDHDPELYVTKKQLEDLIERGFGTLSVSFVVQGGKIKTLSRNIELTNVSDPQTSKIKVRY
jgi:hypothetical protein